jgi:hypothetical protein
MSNVPPAPPLKPRPGRQPQSNSGTILALFGVILIGGALLGLVALVMPQVMGIVVVVGGLFIVPLVLHYLTWGWWLSQMKDERAEDESAIKPPPSAAG